MKYILKGGNFPIVECILDKNERIVTESGSMCWMDSNIKMNTSSNGGLKKIFGRYMTREKLFQNIYTSQKDGSLISFASCVPGSIMAIEIDDKKSVICQKSAFLAGYGDIKLSTYFNKKISTSLFGGEGFIMQKITGNGIVFLEIDGSSIEYELTKNDTLILSSGFLVSISETCSLEVEMIKGFKNVFLGGEGLFNTRVKGPGKVIVQTMPISKLGEALNPHIETVNPNTTTSNNNTEN